MTAAPFYYYVIVYLWIALLWALFASALSRNPFVGMLLGLLWLPWAAIITLATVRDLLSMLLKWLSR